MKIIFGLFIFCIMPMYLNGSSYLCYVYENDVVYYLSTVYGRFQIFLKSKAFVPTDYVIPLREYINADKGRILGIDNYVEHKTRRSNSDETELISAQLIISNSTYIIRKWNRNGDDGYIFSDRRSGNFFNILVEKNNSSLSFKIPITDDIRNAYQRQRYNSVINQMNEKRQKAVEFKNYLSDEQWEGVEYFSQKNHTVYGKEYHYSEQPDGGLLVLYGNDRTNFTGTFWYICHQKYIVKFAEDQLICALTCEELHCDMSVLEDCPTNNPDYKRLYPQKEEILYYLEKDD